MTRVRTVRVLTCHASLACGHDVHIRAHGFYPAAAICPACPLAHTAWITTMQVSDGQALIGNDACLPAPQVVAVDMPPAVAPALWQTYSVGVATARRHLDTVPHTEYVLNAANVTEAVVLAARAAIADADETVETLTILDEDDLPTIHIGWLRIGMPLHPADTPGLAWNDLRPDSPAPAATRTPGA